MQYLDPINMLHIRIITPNAYTHQAENADRQNARMHDTTRKTIRQYIETNGTTERQLALDCAVVQSTLNRFMGGVTESLGVADLQKLARHMSMTTSELLGEVTYSTDRKTLAVVHAMEAMPEYKKDMLVAQALRLLNPKKIRLSANNSQFGDLL